jgi:hypothetical protein
MTTQLNFINNSTDANNSDITIFQKNVATSTDETAVAWTVIQNSSPGQETAIAFPADLQIAVTDSWGNHTAAVSIEPGQLFVIRPTPAGPQLAYDRPAPQPDEICLLNALSQGAITVQVYRDGRLLATQTDVAPQQTALFNFSHSIWIGPSQQVVEGQALNTAALVNVNTELSLLGIASANIVMTGGGPGPNSTPFAFNLQPTPLVFTQQSTPSAPAT